MNANKNTTVIRNGRSTSQVSIYNYPEHLNPFYEDDNHKRLRFWNFGKSKNNDLRRNSFSFSAIRGIWDFKSFRLKKKSSSLGINKTSESPPMLHRPITMPEKQFERTNSSRRSLQNMHFSEYNTKSKSLTLQPTQKLEIYANKNNESRLSLTNSIASTGSESSNFLRTPTIRKKNKAPPIPVNNNNDVLLNKSAQDKIQNNSENERSNQENILEIANLTAEIENFCKTVCSEESSSHLDGTHPNEVKTNNSNNNLECKTTECKTISREEPSSHLVGTHPNEVKTNISNSNLEYKTTGCKTISREEPSSHLDGTHPNEAKTNNSKNNLECKFIKIEKREYQTNDIKNHQENKNKVINIEVSQDISSKKNNVYLDKIENTEPIEVKQIILNENTSCSENLSDIPKQLMMNTNQTQKNTNEISQKINKSEKINTHFDIESQKKEKYIFPMMLQEDKCKTKTSQVKFKQPVNSIQRPSELVIREPELDYDLEHNYQYKNYSSQVCTLAPLKEHVSRDKNNLVKDIIESISRNQRLLNGCSNKIQTDSEKNENKMEEEVKILNPMVQQESEYSQELNKIDNNEILIKDQIKKKTFYNRESSPTANNLDWNPVPKPKRVKNYPND